MALRSYLRIGSIVAAGVVVVLLAVVTEFFLPMPVGTDRAPQTILIPPGSSFSQVCHQLQERGLVRDRWALILLARITGLERHFPAGEITLQPGMSVWQLVWTLRKSEASTVDVTLPEGLSAREIAAILQAKGVVDSAAFVRAQSNPELHRRLQINAPDLEGYLFPDTYNLYRRMDADAVVQKMVDRFSEIWNDSMTTRANQLGWSIRQVLTLASIIQGEVIVPSEAPMVSSVYHNRLKAGMLLQADPTIQYIITNGPRRLLRDDLEIDSPYNTYRHRGLPPGPISNPGRAAILAGLYPADTNYLYFVAKGDGSHAFNATEEGHWRDKWRFQKVRREVARNNAN